MRDTRRRSTKSPQPRPRIDRQSFDSYSWNQSPSVSNSLCPTADNETNKRRQSCGHAKRQFQQPWIVDREFRIAAPSENKKALDERNDVAQGSEHASCLNHGN